MHIDEMSITSRYLPSWKYSSLRFQISAIWQGRVKGFKRNQRPVGVCVCGGINKELGVGTDGARGAGPEYQRSKLGTL